MRFANGVQWTYRTEKPFFKIEGTEGWIYADYKELKAEATWPRSSHACANWPRRNHTSTSRPTSKTSLTASRAASETLEPAEVGHRVTSLGHLGQIAIQLGQKLKWDPEKERFLDNDAANAFLDKPIHAPRYA